MNISRLPRFERISPVSAIKITERDRDIIRLVNRHRFLHSSQISAHVDGNSQQILRRLQLLYHHGYLERPRCQLDYYHRGGSRRIVYGIGSRGADLLSRQHGIPMGKVRWGEKNRSIGRVHLEHTLFVSEVMLAIQLACRQRGIRLLLDEELPVHTGNRQRSPFRWSVSLSHSMKLGVIPDRVFGLEFCNQKGILERTYFFLEADRGTMPVIRQNLAQTSFFRKLIAYQSTWSQSIHARFGFHRFRVLTIANSSGRVQSLIDACSKLERGHGLFVFAERTILDMPGEIFSKMWRTAVRGEKVSLLS